MDKLLYQLSSRAPSPRFLRRPLLPVCLAIFLLNNIGCSVQRDQRTVEAASLKTQQIWMHGEPGKRGVITAFNPNASNPIAQNALTPKSNGPMLLDENGDTPLSGLFNRGQATATSLLPALYIDQLKGDETRLSFVADPGRRNLVLTSFAPAAMTLEKYEIADGAELKGSVFLPAGDDALYLLWIDESGRVAAAQQVQTDAAPITGNAAGIPFQFKMPAGTFGHKHKVALVRVPPKVGATKVEAVEQFRVIAELSWQDYVVFSRDDSARRLFPAHSAKLELALLPGENPVSPSNFNATAAAYAKSRDPKLLERQPAVLNDAAMQKALAALEKNLAAKSTGLNLWSLGDGAALTHQATPIDFDHSAEALTDYRTWLQERRYESLKALNTQWKSDEKDWTKILPPTTDSIKERGSKVYAAKFDVLKKGDPEKTLERRGEDPAFVILPKDLRVPGGENWAAWADFRTYNDYVFASALNVFRQRATSLDSRVQVGLTNLQTPSAWGGWEYGNLARSLDWAEEHSSFIAREILVSLSHNQARPIHFLTQTSGIEPVEIHRLWDRWLRGDNGCLLATAAASPPPIDDIAEMTRGLTLLRNLASRRSDPIAIYYSPRSVYLHWMLDSEEDGSTWVNRDAAAGAARDTAHLQMKAWLMLLEDLGYAPYFVSPEEVAEGALRLSAAKVVILPKVLSLSHREAQALREFAQAGGCVIADGECGTFDGAGKRRGPLGNEPKQLGALDVDFGIARKDFKTNERDGRFKGDAANARLTIKSGTGKNAGPDSPELRVLETGVVPVDATPHAGTSSNIRALFSRPAKIKNVAGKGRFFYLNLCLIDYPRLRAEKTAPNFKFNGMTEISYVAQYGAPTGGEALRLAISDILDEVVGENVLRVTSENGAAMRGIKHASFRINEGGGFFHALMPLADFGSEAGKSVLLGAPLGESVTAFAGDGEKHFWYDMRAGEFLGQTVEAKCKLQPNRPALLSALPYSVDRVSLQVRRINQSNVFKITAFLQCSGRPGLHVIHVDVADTAGNVMPWHSANVVADGGSVTHEIAIGINDPAGTYHVKVRDVLTGKSAEGDLVKESVEFNGLNFDENVKR